MNRLSNYFSAAKLVKLYAKQADEYARKDELKKALLCLTTGMTYMLQAMNNVSSIGFHQKPRRKKQMTLTKASESSTLA